MATAKETKNLTINDKLSAIQTKIKAPKNLYNSFGKYNYRNAESILEAVKPYLESLNLFLVINDSIVMVGERYYVRATATLADCETGESIEVSAYARETEEKKGMDGSQVTGATSSYARKYALNGLFLLDDTKDANTDEYAKTTGKVAPKEASEQELKDELNGLWEKAGGKDGFEDWYKKNTEKGFSTAVYATMKATLMKKINDDKAKESK